MHLQTPYSEHVYFLDTDIVYKPLTFRIDQSIIWLWENIVLPRVSVKKNEWMRARVCVFVKELMNVGARVCVHLFKHAQTQHVTYDTVHGNGGKHAY